MGITKSGIITSPNICESSAMNYVDERYIGKSFQYTPSTGTNSCLGGFIVNYPNCIPGEKIYISIKVEWNGFDTSNTNGTFSMYFQGATYNVSTGEWEWAGHNNVSYALGGLTSLVLSSLTGSAILKSSCIIDSQYPSVRTREYLGIRSDYSNGTGWIRISDLEVIPERYYVPKNQIGGSTSLHIGKDYISTGELCEI